jgi:hypothetical protein
MLREWSKWVQIIAEAVRKNLPNAEVCVIGSVVRGDYVGGSDVDVLVISEEIPDGLSERSKIKVMIEDESNLQYYHPFEIHLLKPEEAEIYLRKAGKQVIKV